MRLISVKLYRFGSFREETTFDFPEGPGLFFLRGDNREEPALEANGAGKSTLWNAICWCIFDRTVKGLRAGDVANWEEPKGASVRMIYEDDLGTQIEVRRQHAPNKWEISADGEPWIDLTKHADNPFLADLRLGLEPFLNCVLMGQGRPMFIDLTPTKKAELFSDILNLDIWLERSKRASKRADEQDAISRDLERKLSGVEGQLRGIDRAALEGEAADWLRAQKQREDLEIGLHDEALTKRRKRKAAADELKAVVEDRRGILRAETKLLEKARADLEDAKDLAAKRKREADDCERWLQERSARRDSFRRLAHCPQCEQEVPHEHRERIIAEMQKEITPRVGEQVELWEDLNHAATHVDILRADLPSYERDVEKARAKLDEAERDLRQAENDTLYLDKDLDRLEDSIERISKERNPFASMRDEALDKERGLQELRRHLQRQLDDSNEQFFFYSYWVKGFKELRLKLIDASLQELEIEVNSCVGELGLNGWALRFEVDKETKGGSISRGFNVLVESPHNDRPVPWEAWSGGEGQRLRVATQMGLGDLCRARTGATLDLEVWDEPTEHLSAQGVTDLLDSLAARARREQRQVWVVDHRSLGYGAFSDVYTVIKDEAGSRFE